MGLIDPQVHESMKKEPFWKVKPLNRMTSDEWESLCDGCGICCLEKEEDEDTGKIETTSVSCSFLDIDTCHCMIYHERLSLNPECLSLTPETIKDLNWLPMTCAYRCVAEGRDLEWWHPLVSGDPETVHRAGVSIRGKVVSGSHVHPDEIINSGTDE